MLLAGVEWVLDGTFKNILPGNVPCFWLPGIDTHLLFILFCQLLWKEADWLASRWLYIASRKTTFSFFDWLSTVH